jgi:carbon starvation protein CstA
VTDKWIDNSRWYKLFEYMCQFLAVITFCYRGFSVLLKQNPTMADYIPLLPIPAMFMLFSMFFHFLSSRVATSGPSPFISSVLALVAAMDITGVHLIVLIVLVGILASSAITGNKDLKEITKYFIGLFAGMQWEKGRGRNSRSSRSSHATAA